MTTITVTIAAILLLHTSIPGIHLLNLSRRLPPWLYTFVNCPQCFGFWVAAILVWVDIPLWIQIPIYTGAILTLIDILKGKYYDEGNI